MKTIANGFAADLPDGWEDRTMMTLVGPTGPGGFAPNVVVTRERLPPGTRIEDYAQAQLKGASIELPGLQVLDEKATKLDGLPAIQRVQRFAAGARQIQQSQTFALGPDRAMVVTCSAQREDFERCPPAFEKVLGTLRFFAPSAVMV